MSIILQAALLGLGLAAFLVLIEYIFVKKGVQERAELHHRKPEFEDVDRMRIRAVLRFSVFIPPAFALGAWLIWG
jgi:hypothetical protein